MDRARRTRERDITDYPLVTLTQAAVIFGWSRDQFRERFISVLHDGIRSVKTTSGMKLLLTDVLRSAFPEASNHTVHVLAFEYLLHLAKDRKEKWGKKKMEMDEA